MSSSSASSPNSSSSCFHLVSSGSYSNSSASAEAAASSSSSHSSSWSSSSSPSYHPSLAGWSGSVGKMSKVKPLPSQFGVGHIQNPSSLPGAAFLMRWNQILSLMKVRRQ